MRIKSITLCCVFFLSIIFNNNVLSIASNNQYAVNEIVYPYPQKIYYEDNLVEEKYIEISSKEDLDTMREYSENWENACLDPEAYGNYNIIHDRKYYYPFYIQFIVQNNITYDTVKEILSKYDTNLLFGYTFSSNHIIQYMKEYLNSSYYKKTNSDGTVKISNSVILKKFNGTDKQLLELFKNLLNDTSFSFEHNNSEKINEEYFHYLVSVFKLGMYNDESRYSVRFNNEDEYLRAIEELNYNDDIFVERTFSSEVLVMKQNSIVVSYDPYYNVGAEGMFDESKIENFEKKLLETIKNELNDYDLNYIELLKYKGYPAQRYILSIENIKKEDLMDICSILYKREQRNPSRILRNPIIKFTNIEDSRGSYICHTNLNIYERKHTNQIYQVKNSDGSIDITSDVGNFYKTIIDKEEDCVIYPMYNKRVIGEYTPVNRLYNKNTGEHLFVSKESEFSKLRTNGWIFEGSAFITDDSNTENLKKVYRVYNPNVKGGDHHYTMSYNEASNLVQKGWKWDNNAKPIFFSGGNVEVYRLYNKNNGRHHYTKSESEKNKLVKLGWKYEGIAWSILE